jgi:hypothetical protein
MTTEPTDLAELLAHVPDDAPTDRCAPDVIEVASSPLSIGEVLARHLADLAPAELERSMQLTIAEALAEALQR